MADTLPEEGQRRGAAAGAVGRSEAEEAEDAEDEAEQDEDEQTLAGAIPRSDAGELAHLRSLGISGADGRSPLFDVKESDDEEGPTLPPTSASSDVLGDGGDALYDSGSEETVPLPVRPDIFRSAFWGELSASDTDCSTFRLQHVMRKSGCHIEVCGGVVTVFAPSARSRDDAMSLLTTAWQGWEDVTGCADTPEEGDVYESSDTVSISHVTFRSTRDLSHECVYPTILEGTVGPLSILNFDDDFPWKLDEFQNCACTCVANHESVLVAASTSAGKTAVAEYAIAQSLRSNRRVLYTSPLKALSNQKYVDLQRRFPGCVGLMTGDVTIHPDARVIILTTEVLATMVFHQLPTQPDLFDDFDWVVFDEAQYIGDEQRGTTWEECFIFLPEHLRCLLLTATIPNTKSIASWIARTRVEIVHIICSVVRPVPLKHEVFRCGDDDPLDKRRFISVYSGGRHRQESFRPEFERLLADSGSSFGVRQWKCLASLMARFIGAQGANLRDMGQRAGGAYVDVGRQQPYAISISASSRAVSREAHTVVRDWLHHHGHRVEMPPDRFDNLRIDPRDLEKLLMLLKYRKRLPMIGFTFEKEQCEQIALTIAGDCRMDFATADKKRQIDQVISDGLERLLPEDRKLKQVAMCTQLLRRGIGVHHSGMLPFVREMTELLFTRGLLDVVFATDTFAIGINVPAKTVVFCALSKFDGTQRRPLHVGEFLQMAGRAGRRGIDKEGNSVVLARQPMEGRERTVDVLWQLYAGSPPDVCSRFRLRWSSLVHMLRSGPGHVTSALDRSFCEGSQRAVADLAQEGTAMQAFLHRKSYLEKSGALLPKGEMLARLAVPLDAVFVTEVLIATKGFAGLDVSQIFAVCSCFVGNGPQPKEKVQVGDRDVAAMLDKARGIAVNLYEEFVRDSLQPAGGIVSFVNARLHPQLADTTLLWAKGVDFTEAVQRSRVSIGGEGVLVRAFRRLDELMREIGYVCKHLLGMPELAAAIQAKRTETRRGVLVAPSLYLGDAEDPTAEPIPQQLPMLQCPYPVGATLMFCPLEIGFSHNTCGERFRDSQVSLLTTARALIFKWVSWSTLPTVRVYWHRGRLYTLANRRLAAARLWALALGDGAVRISALVASEAEAHRWGWQHKFTTGFSQGRSVRISTTNKRVGCTRQTTTFGAEFWA